MQNTQNMIWSFQWYWICTTPCTSDISRRQHVSKNLVHETYLDLRIKLYHYLWMKLMSIDELVVSCCFTLSIQCIYGTPYNKNMGSWKVLHPNVPPFPWPASVLPVIASPPAVCCQYQVVTKEACWEIPPEGCTEMGMCCNICFF